MSQTAHPTTSGTQTLIDFLHARLDEDEAAATEAEVKRVIITWYTEAASTVDDLTAARTRLKTRGLDTLMTELDLEKVTQWRNALYGVLSLLALRCAQHPGYREEWRP